MDPEGLEASDIMAEELQEEFLAEAVINKRGENGEVEYLVKWSGKEATWELASNLRLTDLIEAFEDESKRKILPRGLEAEQIIGCTDKLGYLQFLVKWKGVDKADLISAKEVKEKYPKMVLNFYQERLSWNQDS